jgi:hypothetical protein
VTRVPAGPVSSRPSGPANSRGRFRCIRGIPARSHDTAGHILTHEADGGLIDQAGRCADCQHLIGVRDTVLGPGPGRKAPGPDADPVSTALMTPHRLLQTLLG